MHRPVRRPHSGRRLTWVFLHHAVDATLALTPSEGVRYPDPTDFLLFAEQFRLALGRLPRLLLHHPTARTSACSSST